MVRPKNDGTRANNDEITSHCFDERPLHQHRQISSCTKPCTKPSQSSRVVMPRCSKSSTRRRYDCELPPEWIPARRGQMFGSRRKLWKLNWKAANLSAPSRTQEVRAGWLMPLVGVGLL